jgi:hypothetical protein
MCRNYGVTVRIDSDNAIFCRNVPIFAAPFHRFCAFYLFFAPTYHVIAFQIEISLYAHNAHFCAVDFVYMLQ